MNKRNLLFFCIIFITACGGKDSKKDEADTNAIVQTSIVPLRGSYDEEKNIMDFPFSAENSEKIGDQDCKVRAMIGYYYRIDGLDMDLYDGFMQTPYKKIEGPAHSLFGTWEYQDYNRNGLHWKETLTITKARDVPNTLILEMSRSCWIP